MATTEVYRVDSCISDFFLVFNLLICAETVGIFGIMGNIFNICNFYRQGITDSVTMTLVALAVSDIGALVSQQGYNIVTMPWMSTLDADVNIWALIFFFFYPNGYFIRVGGLIKTLATFERCMSVISPLTVKLIFTRKVSLVANIIIYVVMLIYLLPPFYVAQFGYVFIPSINKSMFTAVLRNNAHDMMQMNNVVFYVADLAIPYLIFIINIICTSLITKNINIKSKWRISMARESQPASKKQMLRKEKRLIAMLVTMSVIFIVCLFPHCLVLTAYSVLLELHILERYVQLLPLCYSFTLLLETINCSVSCIIYLKMSSKFRNVTREMLGFCKR